MNNLVPDWPAPRQVKTLFTTRRGGFSDAPYDSCNLGLHVGDKPDTVERNRACLDLPGKPQWLDQVHSSVCVEAGDPDMSLTADACVTHRPKQVLAVMVADCLPILLATRDGQSVGVAHAGWRGLANGVIASAHVALNNPDLLAWLGPSIGACHYEVGADVRGNFDSDVGFESLGRDKYRMDLDQIARAQLESRGVEVFGGGFCTYCDDVRFYSYRRDGVTGRMAGFIWIE